MSFFVPGDLEFWPWPSNSSKRGTKHVFRVNLGKSVQRFPRSVIFRTQTKEPQTEGEKITQSCLYQ